jgi:peptide/nickel transport system substrate-binding protein
VLIAALAAPDYYRACNSFLVCGSPNGTEAGAEDFRLDLTRAKQLLTEAGYKGEPIRMPAMRDIALMGPMAEVAADAMRKAGLNVQLEWSDWDTVISRTSRQKPPAAGGWNIYVTGTPGVRARHRHLRRHALRPQQPCPVAL